MPALRFKHLRTKLLVWMMAVVFLLTAATLILVQARMRKHVREDLISTLKAQAATFAASENTRQQQTEESAMLIAEQPTLKALMSTNDPTTVDGELGPFLRGSAADLMVLDNPAREILGFRAKSDDVPLSTVKRLMRDSSGSQDWWFAGGHLYDVSTKTIWMGAGENRRPVGRIAIGREVSPQTILSAGVFGKTAFAFERNGKLLLSSLKANAWTEFEASLQGAGSQGQTVQEIDFEGERYLETFVEMAGDHPVRLYCFQSFDAATSFLRSLNQLLLILGTVVLVAGGIFTFVLSRQITRPLERLAFGTQQLEKGDFDFQIPVTGDDEVAGLTRSFERMRESLRQSREGLLRSARLEAVGRLAGGVAHDFNNLVMIIKGYSDLLLETATPENRAFIEEIKNAGDRASGLTRQLLAFSRKQVLETQVLDLNQTVKSMVKMLRVLIGEDIELITNMSDDIGRVKADPGQLEQVIMNLAVNARDAMPSGGKLIIETSAAQLDDAYAAAHAEVAPGSYVLISVTDSGCGMDKATLKHIFEPFFTTKEPGKGTGLGLATVYGILKQSRGHVSVYSEPDIGTTFKVYLPSLDKSVPLAHQQRVGDAPRGEGTILLVEDEAPLRVLAAESLKKLGYSVLQASNGLEALALADQHAGRIDLLLTDVVMPRMGGPELAQKLKSKRNELSVIFMSGYTETAALENNALDRDFVLLNKPFSTEAMARKIAETLSPKPMAKSASAGT
jgi:signal transduction histidine kinase/CheY-like chemotaxis protein